MLRRGVQGPPCRRLPTIDYARQGTQRSFQGEDQLCGHLPKKDTYESNQEAEVARINLTEEDPRILVHILVYFYTNNYSMRRMPEFLKAAAAPSRYSSIVNEAESGWSEEMYELLVDAMVFKYADMLGIELLKQLAALKFLRYAPIYLQDKGFAEALRVVYESTLSDDPYLRSHVTKICVSNHKRLAEGSETIKVIMEHEPIAWKIGVEMHQDAEMAHLAVLQDIKKEGVAIMEGLDMNGSANKFRGIVDKACADLIDDTWAGLIGKACAGLT